MPELPDLIYIERQLAPKLVGSVVKEVRVGDPTPLRMMIPGDIRPLLQGRRLQSIKRRGHFIRFGFDQEVVIVINAMLAGRYVLEPAEGKKHGGGRKPDPKAMVLALAFEQGEELRYLDSKLMGKVYVVSESGEAQIPAYNALGVDVMSDAFKWPVFQKLAKKRRDQVRNFLMDKTALASIGNAYADEILFDSGLHPKTFCYQLDDAQRERLFHSVSRVLRHAVDHIAQVEPDVSDKVRDFLSVRGRSGEPCLRCGTTVRSVRVGVADADFCPTCQPAKRALFIDWGHKPAEAGNKDDKDS